MLAQIRRRLPVTLRKLAMCLALLGLGSCQKLVGEDCDNSIAARRMEFCHRTFNAIVYRGGGIALQVDGRGRFYSVDSNSTESEIQDQFVWIPYDQGYEYTGYKGQFNGQLIRHKHWYDDQISIKGLSRIRPTSIAEQGQLKDELDNQTEPSLSEQIQTDEADAAAEQNRLEAKSAAKLDSGGKAKPSKH